MNMMLLKQLKSGSEKVIESPNGWQRLGDVITTLLQNHSALVLV